MSLIRLAIRLLNSLMIRRRRVCVIFISRSRLRVVCLVVGPYVSRIVS